MVKKKSSKAPVSPPPAKPWGASTTPRSAEKKTAALSSIPPPITKDSPIPSSAPLWLDCEQKLLALIDERINEHKKALMVHHLKVQQMAAAGSPKASDR